MKRKNEFEGLIETAHKLHKLINPNAIPRDPHEVIALAKQMEYEEDLRNRARRAAEQIREMRRHQKERKEFARKMDRFNRHEKLKRIWQGIKDVHG